MATATRGYRDERESLQARLAQLEGELAERTRRVGDLERELEAREVLFERVKGLIDREHDAPAETPAARSRAPEAPADGARDTPTPPRGDAAAARRARRRLACAAVSLAVVGGGVTWALGLAASKGPVDAPSATTTTPAVPTNPAAAAPEPVAAHPLPAAIDLCAQPGVHLTLAGADAVAPARGDRDLSGHKYRRGGDRSPWFTVAGGPLYVHAVGGYLPGDVGTTELTLLTLTTAGDDGGYRLAHGGRSLFEVQGSNGKHIYGRFEADVSKVSDTTRAPAFGTPVVRVRGTFCLPAMPASPHDTAP